MSTQNMSGCFLSSNQNGQMLNFPGHNIQTFTFKGTDNEIG